MTTKAPQPLNLPLPPFPTEKFGVISIDPPWHFRTRGAANEKDDRSPQKHYPTMSLAEIAKLPIRDLALPDAWVMLWITGPLMAKGVHNKLFDRWGVEASSTAFVWVKLWNNFETDQLARTPLLEQDLALGTGFTTRQNAEFVILGKIGSPKRARADIRQMIVSPRREHSRKPEEFFRRAQYFATGPHLDMFAGATREGWTAFGWPHRHGERPEDARPQD